jgi:hypothetical protein
VLKGKALQARSKGEAEQKQRRDGGDVVGERSKKKSEHSESRD